MSRPFLIVERLTVRFGADTALQEVDLQLDEDELLVVLGPTGAGKTTLLRTLAGLQAAAAGRILMAGEEVVHWSPAQRDVALVFQNFSLYPDWTVRRNLLFPLQAPGRRLDASGCAARIAWAAELLQITHLLDRPAARLSGGEMQRVAIGRALVRRPRLFLFDEPLTNLDAKLRERLRVELAVLRRNLGIPMIYVTHDQAEALSMGDRVAVLSQGRILQVGSSEQVYRAPASPVVARQLGQPAINLFPVRCDAGFWVTEEGIPLARAAETLPIDGGQPLTEGGPAVIGIRPSDLLPAGGSVAATLRMVENAGATQVLVADWRGREVYLQVDKSQRFAVGDAIAPQAAPAAAILWVGGS